MLVAADVDHAVGHVDARVDGLDGAVDFAALHVSAYHIVAHLQGNDLLVVKHVFDDHDGAAALLVGVFVESLLLAGGAELGHAHAYAELLAALRTFEDQ